MRPATRYAWRVLLSGSIASLLSSAVITAESRRRTGRAASGTNATSQWIWGERARRRERASWRHTALGYAIHHASSLFWATLFESRFARQVVTRAGARAAIVATAAAIVDYAVVPRRLTPGIEAHLPARAIAVVYAAFGIGLWLGRRVHRTCLHSGASSASRPRAAGPLSTRPSTASKREP